MTNSTPTTRAERESLRLSADGTVRGRSGSETSAIILRMIADVDRMEAENERLRKAMELLFPVSEGFGEEFDTLKELGLIVMVPADEVYREEWGDDTMYVWAWHPLALSERQGIVADKQTEYATTPCCACEGTGVKPPPRVDELVCLRVKLAESRRVVEGLVEWAEHRRECDMRTFDSYDPAKGHYRFCNGQYEYRRPLRCTCGLDAVLARAAEWLKGATT